MNAIPKIRVIDVTFSVIPTQTRFPFRYGIAAMTEAPHWFIHSHIEVDSVSSHGLASEGLPPKWFTKNPDTAFEDDDLPGMERVINQAAAFAKEIDEPMPFFRFWQNLKKAQDKWAEKEEIPPLLSQLGVALMERSILDGFCKAVELPLHEAIRLNLPGIELGEIHPELDGVSISEVFSKPPLDSVSARHTIGLGDALTDGDILEGDRTPDGLPHSLVANIHAYGLDHFKIKLCGDLEVDRLRCIELSQLFETEIKSGDYHITLDGNEQYKDVETFREHFNILQSAPELNPLFDHLLFVEQPIHRDFALDDSVRTGFKNWRDSPAVIIDESDASVECLPRALSVGYSGTSHKNCKGIVKSLANRALLDQRGGGILSAEDLVNIGPVALLQDLATVSLLQISHVERNGHHYFAGLSMFSEAIQEEVLAKHGDLYQRSESGFPTLRIEAGAISTKSINSAPFGCLLPSQFFPGSDLPDNG